MDWNVNPFANPALRRPPPPLVSPWYDPFGLLHTEGSGNYSLAKRDDVAGGNMGTNFENNIGQSAGCPTTQKVVYLGVAADCVYTSTYGSTQNATKQIITNLNTASALYKSTFNVSLGIVELQIQDTECPSTTDSSAPWNMACSDSVTLNDRLSLFSAWRGQKGNDGAGLWHLMSGCPTGTEVGIAWLATLCQQTAAGSPGSVVSGTAVSTAGRVEWQVVAHEIGHNFGAIHDCAPGCDSGNSSAMCCPLSKDSCNANSQFIMSPVADQGEQKFSACSLGNICSLMLGNSGGMTNTTCLIEAADAKNTISLGMCGNGIVEEGEECDPGQGVNSTCCNASTCKLNSGAVCDPSNSPCCSDSCAFAPATQVCRPAKDASCDQAEMCTGSSATCPADKFSPNGQSCGANGLACASGTCTSLDKQCQTVGASMNLTTACPSQNDKSCQVSCQDPTSSNQCIVLQSQLVDGSSCGYGGTCASGTCQAGSFLDTAKAWYTQNLQISIPVTVVAGIVVLLILYGLIRFFTKSCRRGRKRGFMYEPELRGKQGQQRLSSWPNGQVAIPVMAQAPGARPPYPLMYGSNAPQYPAGAHNRGRSDGWAMPSSPSAGTHRPTRSTGSNQYRP
ncbi:hypothetical protein PHLGIDRAFT_119917 [Phlebiopsis gigantea 11061_1 CR5-6]|uniref:Disintegrin and metalloproteinase domain-containing protein B n=1 Tax=Phlebiopsis gigantea (strain 11061_1 CR5-6) TaxID=745531 RepID=A0A0C3RVK9_PHLG1|nr:hypothetical protein PHLGIDRAFT_119917 [Phlebiopsis gigantea 11061_1 CR5-6]